MSKIQFRDHMMNQFSLLEKDKKQIIDDKIQKNIKDKEIAESIDRELTGKNIPVPKMDHLADTIWALRHRSAQALQQAQSPRYFDKLSTGTSTIRRVKRKKIMMRIGSALAAAAAVAVIFTTGIFKRVSQQSQTISITLTLTMGRAEILPGRKKLKKNIMYNVKIGESILTAHNTRVIARIPGNGRFELINTAKVTLRDFKKKDKSNIMSLNIETGHLLVNIDKSSYKIFRVKTPHTLVTVTGTSFELFVNNRKTSVKVKRGEVKCTLISDNSKTITLTVNDNADFVEDKIIPLKQDNPKKNLNKKTEKTSREFRERVHLKNGMVITGNIVSQDKTTLVVRTPAGIMRISRNKVKNVEYIK